MVDIDLVGLLQGRVSMVRTELDATADSFAGVTVGVVTDIKDPQGLGRVKVRLPLLGGRFETGWARVAMPWAGQRRGSYLLPEVDDEVLVAFRHGNLAYPFVVGCLWNDKDRPPEASPERHRRELRSKKGHRVLFDDGDGTEQLTLHSQGGLEVVLDDAANKVRITGGRKGQSVSITLDTRANAITVTAEAGNISIEAPEGKVAISGQTVQIEASAGLTLSGQPVHINPPAPAGPPISEGTA